MKPVKLIMQAFLSYKERQEIDFTKLNGKLFLIDGLTGAGKTTIFDAMCYALYGQASNTVRESKNFKSDYADACTTCFVEFSFTQNGTLYTIHREPEQYRKSKRKNKDGKYDLVNDKAVQVLTYDNKSLTNSYDVALKIKEILNLDLNQFRQTMMIAQGKFSELVQADTDSRRKLFREILNTSGFEKFEGIIKEKYLNFKNEIEADNIAINSKLSSFKTSNLELSNILNNNPSLYDYDKLLDLLNNELEINKTNKSILENDVNNLNKLILLENKNRTEKDIANKNLEKYKNDLLKLNELNLRRDEFAKKEKLIKHYKDSKYVYDLYEKYNFCKNEYDRLNCELNENKLKLNTISNDYNLKLDNYKKIKVILNNNEELSKKITALDDLISSFSLVLSKEKEVGILNEDNNKIKKENEILTNNYTKLCKDLNELNNFVKENENINVLVSNSKQKLESIDNEINKLKIIFNKFNAYKASKENTIEYKNNVSKKLVDFLNSKNKYDILYEHYLLDQAGLIAKTLKENIPCPVCGSLVHNKLAQVKYNISKEDVDKALKEKDDKNKLYNEALKEQETFEKSLENELKNIKEKILEILNVDTQNVDNVLDSLNDTLNKKRNDENTNYLKLDKILKEFNEKKKSLDKLNNDKDEIEEKINSNNTKISSNENLISGYNGEIKTIKEKIKNNSKEGLLKEKNRLDDEYKINKDSVSKYEKEYNEINIYKTSLDSLIKRSEIELPERKENLNKAFELYNKALSNSILKDINLILELLKNNNNDSINKLEEELNDYNTDCKVYNMNLAEDLKRGYDKITFTDLSVFDKKIDDLKAEYDLNNNKFVDISHIYSTNLAVIESYEKIHNSIKSKSEITYMLKELYEVSNGQVSGKEKIDFETYYQSQVFGNILKIASIKLSKMTDGRYTLFRHIHDETKDGTKKTSLDIDIFDTTTGKLRSSKSLSGGETFMTSLALALGFSEIIRNESGACELDCMFIDEGFGSLDSNALSSVLNVLKNLSNEHERLIGIISHVEELSYEINSKINVTKDLNGSHLEVVCD